VGTNKGPSKKRKNKRSGNGRQNQIVTPAFVFARCDLISAISVFVGPMFLSVRGRARFFPPLVVGALVFCASGGKGATVMSADDSGGVICSAPAGSARQRWPKYLLGSRICIHARKARRRDRPVGATAGWSFGFNAALRGANSSAITQPKKKKKKPGAFFFLSGDLLVAEIGRGGRFSNFFVDFSRFFGFLDFRRGFSFLPGAPFYRQKKQGNRGKEKK